MILNTSQSTRNFCVFEGLYSGDTKNIANMLSSSTFAGLVALTTLAPGVLAACNRTALLEFADAYVFAHENGCYPDPLIVVGSTRDTYLLSGWTKLACTKWTIGQVSNLENIAENFTYVENNKTHEITSGICTNSQHIKQSCSYRTLYNPCLNLSAGD